MTQTKPLSPCVTMVQNTPARGPLAKFIAHNNNTMKVPSASTSNGTAFLGTSSERFDVATMSGLPLLTCKTVGIVLKNNMTSGMAVSIIRPSYSAAEKCTMLAHRRTGRC